MPAYAESEEFLKFLELNGSEIQPNNSGYIIILTDKETYKSGEKIRGKVIMELFHPSKHQDIFIKFKGEQ